MPAAAVIPAPVAYIKVVAVEKLVVGAVSNAAGHPIGRVLRCVMKSCGGVLPCFNARSEILLFYFEELIMLNIGVRRVFSSMG